MGFTILKTVNNDMLQIAVEWAKYPLSWKRR
jgi:hypothetical protein